MAPADSANTVMLDGSPPKAAMFSRTQRSAAIWSWRPLFPLVAYSVPRLLRSSQPSGPRRYWKVTSTTPRPAKAAPSYQGSRAEPAMKPPPWMKTMTGASPPVEGVHTLSLRQSSEVGVPSSISWGSGSCGQAGPNSAASRGCVHGSTGEGGSQRRAPTGGAA